MGGLNETDRLKKDGGLDVKKASVSKPWIAQLRVASEGPTAHPRRTLPVDEALVAHIMANGMVGADGRPWRFLGREAGKGEDGLLTIDIGDGSRRHKAGVEAERRLRAAQAERVKRGESRVGPLQWDKSDPSDLGRLYVEIELFVGTDAEFILARIAANAEPGKLPDSVEVLAIQVAQLAAIDCEDIDAIVAATGLSKREVQALARWKLLTPAARFRFVEADLPVGVLSAVLDAPPAEQLALVENFIANDVRTAHKATIRTKKAREERTGEPATKGRLWRPAKLVACANAVFAAPDPGGDDAAFARGFAAALRFAAGEKTGRLPRVVTAAIKSCDKRGGKKS